MNERIRELANQCHHQYSEHNIDLEKFAESIIKECIEQIQLSTARDPQTSIQYLQSVGHIHRIREHFGIEK